jgi:hypothetical protein
VVQYLWALVVEQELQQRQERDEEDRLREHPRDYGDESPFVWGRWVIKEAASRGDLEVHILLLYTIHYIIYAICYMLYAIYYKTIYYIL